MQSSHGKVKTNAPVRGKASKVDDEAVLHTCIPSIFPWTKSATPRNPPEERRRQLAVALLRNSTNTGEKPRARSASTRLPFFPGRQSSGWPAQMVVQWVIQAQWRPLPTTKEVKTDPGVESQGRSQAQLQRSADFPWLGKEKKKKQETNWWVKTLKWQGSSRHVRQKCSRQNPCHPARFDLYAQDDVFANAPSREGVLP